MWNCLSLSTKYKALPTIIPSLAGYVAHRLPAHKTSKWCHLPWPLALLLILLRVGVCGSTPSGYIIRPKEVASGLNCCGGSASLAVAASPFQLSTSSAVRRLACSIAASKLSCNQPNMQHLRLRHPCWIQRCQCVSCAIQYPVACLPNQPSPAHMHILLHTTQSA